ncbi:hypothetical protein SAMN06265218_108139 [Fodinibius sediminis]|uniref:Uncharacterized protein n=1 Tax=Fodinibius sediminis TaxID=1214077 RepID=A0A521D6V9_9BACT|nr:hypothetical protein SAMN06265218_108139 [Fodinibius sediminis]
MNLLYFAFKELKGENTTVLLRTYLLTAIDNGLDSIHKLL